MRRPNRLQTAGAEATPALPELVGRSHAMCTVRTRIRRIAPLSIPVLILGETGTGKELVARRIHLESDRAGRPWVPINCAAIPDTLFEGELFGYSRGAFTGADRTRPGLLESAADGTVFLDEVAELSPAGQAKLLRVLQEQTIRRLGETWERPLACRWIFAAQPSLLERVRTGQFRMDLFFRIARYRIQLPPLRDRPEDIPITARFILRRLTAQFGLRIDRVEPEVWSTLEQYLWPGNVRELEAVLTAAVIDALDGRVLCASHVRTHLGNFSIFPHPAPADAHGVWTFSMPAELTLLEALDRFAYAYVLRTLQQCDGVKVAAARKLRIHRNRLYRILRSHRTDTGYNRPDRMTRRWTCGAACCNQNFR